MSFDGATRLEVNLRDLHPPGVHDRQAAMLDRMRRLEQEGPIQTMTVHVWGKQLPADPRDRTNDPVVRAWKRFETYERWAERTGCDLSPAFARKSLSDPIGEDSAQHVVVVPQISAAVYRQDELCWVFPCRDGDDVYTIEDMIDLFETGRIGAVERRAAGDPVSPRLID